MCDLFENLFKLHYRYSQQKLYLINMVQKREGVMCQEALYQKGGNLSPTFTNNHCFVIYKDEN